MEKIIPLLLFALMRFSLVTAQTKITKIKLSDFGFNSSYYSRDIFKKEKIYNYLIKQEHKKRDIREKLSNFCSENKKDNSENITEKKLKTKNDSLLSALNSMGSLIFCITKINNVGDIFYNVTYATNINIIIDKGVLRRN